MPFDPLSVRLYVLNFYEYSRSEDLDASFVSVGLTDKQIKWIRPKIKGIVPASTTSVQGQDGNPTAR
jgi:hypothetical protein